MNTQATWYGLGTTLVGNSVGDWAKQAGFNWNIKETNVRFNCNDELTIFPGKTVLYRSDNGFPLSVVSMDYKVVQPMEVLEFFSDLVGMGDMKLTTAGVMFGGKRFWALADTGNAAKLRNNDEIKGNLLLTTSCDGTLATNAMFVATNTRNNTTLRLALRSDGKRVRVTHARTFDPVDIKDKLGLIDRAWTDFISGVNALDKVKVNKRRARDFVYDLVKKPKVEEADQPRTTEEKVNAIVDNLADDATAWDIVQAVVDHVDQNLGKTRIVDRKLWNTWHGAEADLKERALEQALEVFNG